MLAREKESSAMRFRQLSRPLKQGEPLPRLPSLIEQVMACRFEASVPEAQDEGDDDEWDDELDVLA